MRSNPNPALASGNTAAAPREQLVPEDLRLAERVQEAYHVSTDRILQVLAESSISPWRIYGLRKPDNPSRPLFRAAADILAMANAGATEAECRMHAILLDEVIDDIYCGTGVRTIDVLDGEEFSLGQRGDCLSATRWRHRDELTPEQLREEALQDRKEAAVSRERARQLEREACRRERSDMRAVARRARA